MPAKGKTLEDLLFETLKDVYYAEKQLIRALPRMAKNCNSEELRQAFETHKEETEGQVQRLERVFELIEKPARAKTCEAMQGLVEEAKEMMEEFKGSPALDAGLIGTAQAVEHYEIARYGALRTWAAQLGLDEAAQLLEQTLEEEKKTDALLTQLAESSANLEAESGEEQGEEESSNSRRGGSRGGTRAGGSGSGRGRSSGSRSSGSQSGGSRSSGSRASSARSGGAKKSAGGTRSGAKKSSAGSRRGR